ncbi:hypothetical protein OJF2_15490 [Aquisphaera giovannonii]|uniref:DUF1570 domain-containing protein n=1 Tax=Aquisphaera giovannonii TaxID=406548 RepID=A0A5B9VXJ6_9BACT|nr:DUF1570 domain-containing protein [Aquisphaera giovannonii]QEH33053.1 hypothetical protein OJF2_15490 [Aquisphaera giovannonii]
MRGDGSKRWTRRAWLGRPARLALTAAGLRLASSPALGQEAKPGEDEEAAVRDAAKAARLAGVAAARSEHFLAVGDAPAGYLRGALDRCEGLGKDFLAHFRARGFEVAYPPRRLTVVGLKDDASYGALLGEAPGKDVGGHFDLDTNRLVIFDFREGGGLEKADAETINLFALVHETSHQLCFNTGLLDRAHVPPLCVSEGLATYVELWRPGVRNAIGGVNKPRLKALGNARDWIDLADLISEDAAFEDDRQQLAYAEGWLLIHYLMRSPGRQARLRRYLASVRKEGAKTPAARLKLAEAALGSLSKLNREVKDEARNFFRR